MARLALSASLVMGPLLLPWQSAAVDGGSGSKSQGAAVAGCIGKACAGLAHRSQRAGLQRGAERSWRLQAMGAITWTVARDGLGEGGGGHCVLQHKHACL
eukprot:TRINITY_DN38900_c0_g1_i1.p2 TRINITY_DN38900_c0_g1~~TRINITY_DN38900_c0_g1_i1.p2  ORF type:complete len:100 (-),score=21.30 TRINITY_DN38900_c0_g1_i1:178-477(-)